MPCLPTIGGTLLSGHTLLLLHWVCATGRQRKRISPRTSRCSLPLGVTAAGLDTGVHQLRLAGGHGPPQPNARVVSTAWRDA
eukprot:10685338-Heterocapsa_arctica.AAC.1